MKTTQAQLIAKIQEHLEDGGVSVTKTQVQAVLRGLGLVVLEELEDGQDVSLPDIGTLKLVHRAARTGRNPQTGASLHIPERYSVRLTPSKRVNEILNQPLINA